MLRTVGLAAARELCLLGRLLPADRAEALGLVTLACEVDQLESSVSELVDELVALPPLTMAAIKRCLIEGNELPLSEGLAVEMAEMVSISATSDAREGVQSFLDRREPEYTGV